MTRFPNLSLFALFLAAGPCGADSLPEGCQVALLRNGFTIQYARREVAGAATRLWLCGDPGSGFVEIPSAQIAGFEQGQSAVAAAPPVSAPEITAGNPIRNLIASVASRQGFATDIQHITNGFLQPAPYSQI